MPSTVTADPPAVQAARRRPPLGRAAPPRAAATHAVLLAGVLTLAAALRVAALGRPSLWFDEAWVIRLAGHDWREIPRLLRVTDAHPPLYYVLMHVWLRLAGTGEVAARAPSAFFGSLSVALTYAFVRRWSSPPVSLLAAFLAGVSPFAVMAAQEARMYALLTVLVLASTLILLLATEDNRPSRWRAYAASAVLMVYTHYLGILVLASHGVWVAWVARPRLRPWLTAVAAVVLLYLPWVPALTDQLAHGSAWPWYRRAAGVVPAGDLCGLLAFGGSLFGMGSYFFPGNETHGVAFLVLLPFLLVLACGLWALRTRPAALGLLALPAGVPVGVMSALSAAGLTFYPRWFSFVAPFFAAALAHGIVEIAGWFRGRRGLAAALLTAALLGCAAPTFARYYLDPDFRPYPWRTAAAVVRAQARPGDFLLYINVAAEVSFSYYFREPHPSFTLVPAEAGPTASGRPWFGEAQARALAARYPRVWLIATPPFTAAMQRRLLPPLDAAFRPAGERVFPAIWIHLLLARGR
jgi:mannosyltransferase